MNTRTWIVIGIITLVVIAGGVNAFMNTNNHITTEKKMENSAIMEKKVDIDSDKKTIKDDVTMENIKERVMDKNAVTMQGSYEAYSPEKLARAETGDVVLFFHASWCPSCRSLSRDIESHMNAIPDGVSILKVDYDNETELKKKYEIRFQHTLVQVDKEGNLIKKWRGSSKLANLLSEIQ